MTLLGPQRHHPNLRAELDRAGIPEDGRVVVVTAGWQERENEDDELCEHLGRPVVNLALHHRSERVFADDPELFAAHRARQDQLREIQRLYRFRLDFALDPARRLLQRNDLDDDVLDPEREAAIQAVRTLDAQHLARIRGIHRDYNLAVKLSERPSLASHLDEINGALDGAAAIAIAGGHVAVLLNRLRLFGGRRLFPGPLPVFAWSAGAMAITRRVVLFHDSPPQGAGNPEILDAGLGLISHVVALPHAHQRLRLDDSTRVALFARRFAPDLCASLVPGAAVFWNGRTWRRSNVSRLGLDGQVGPMEIAA
ncbi:MAG: hypothetical protein AAGD38_14175 [Acidobacteriota bacterium]